MTTSPWIERARGHALPAAEYSPGRPSHADAPRLFTLADLRAACAREQGSRDDDPADRARFALRQLGIVR